MESLKSARVDPDTFLKGRLKNLRDEYEFDGDEEDNKLATGGFGHVYRMIQKSTGKAVAVKFSRVSIYSKLAQDEGTIRFIKREGFIHS